MLKRTMVTGVAILSAAAAVAPTAMAGETDPTAPPPPVTDPAPPPPPPPVTVTEPAPPPVTVTEPAPPPPPPVTVTVPAPAPAPAPTSAPAPSKLHNSTNKSGRGSGGTSGKNSKNSKNSKPRVVTVTRFRTVSVNNTKDTDTGAAPVGGIQAGAGGTAATDHSGLLLGLGSGAIALLLTGGGLVRRRGGDQS
jgi:outer membrane biosynthesis protein TonB